MNTASDDPIQPKREPERPSMEQIRAGHEAVRRANRREVVEDYVEAIDDLNQSVGEARVRDLATGFGISHVAVCSVIERLRRDGLVSSSQQQAIELTEEGRQIADRSRARHGAVLEFLRALGLPEEVAEADAEGMEHHV
ncbi:MAG: iron dependent repressor, metal binding and dimerization domain protein, partial [Planctomycetota bacterium]|nr:iron dependent repressor, metal binding and dimerization domain protein [Planctomycetota bacterium]